MKKKCVIFLFALGVAGFAYDFGWRRPKVKSLYNQSNSLVELGITEEALHYRIEAEVLSKWGGPSFHYFIRLYFAIVTLPLHQS